LKQPLPLVASGVVLSDYGVTRDNRDKGSDGAFCPGRSLGKKREIIFILVHSLSAFIVK
jgi:hypothetical protein